MSLLLCEVRGSRSLTAQVEEVKEAKRLEG